MPHALISGASIAGVATAFWLDRCGWQVTLLERAPAFRDGGQNIDVRGVGHAVLDRMGLTEQVRARGTTEVGTRFVDADGGTVSEFPSEPGSGDGPTAELEILRGDLASLVAEQLPGHVEWIFDDTIAAVGEPGTDGRVRVDLAGGRQLVTDLVVVAEGVRSSTRDLVFGDEVEFDPLDLYLAFGTIPRVPDDDRWWRWYTTTESRQASLRPDRQGTARATLGYLSENTGLETLDRDALMTQLREVFAGAGWQTERILDGFATTDDLYVDHLTQVRMARYHRGRVVVVGDAAWCVTPLGGGGATLALVGAYVLAAQLQALRNSEGELDDAGCEQALVAYEDWMRPLVDQVQQLPPGVPRLTSPRSRVGVEIFRRLTQLASSRIAQRMASSLTAGPSTEQELPPDPTPLS